MKAFIRHDGVVAPILLDNVDTDQIIPSREMKRVSKEGLGGGLFAGWRYHFDGDAKVGLKDDFVLNQPAYRGASILLGGRNFGCGSSREHAVWALKDFGIRAVLAQSFGRIFRANCARNGILAVRLSGEHIDAIRAATESDPQDATIVVDLERTLIVLPHGQEIAFDIDAFDRGMLLQGLDYIDYTLQYAGDIDRFEERDRLNRPWAYL